MGSTDGRNGLHPRKTNGIPDGTNATHRTANGIADWTNGIHRTPNGIHPRDERHQPNAKRGRTHGIDRNANGSH